MLRAQCATDIAVVLGAAIGGPHDQRLAQPVAQGLQLVQRLRVQLQLACAAAGDLSGREVLPAPEVLGHIAEMAEV